MPLLLKLMFQVPMSSPQITRMLGLLGAPAVGAGCGGCEGACACACPPRQSATVHAHNTPSLHERSSRKRISLLLDCLLDDVGDDVNHPILAQLPIKGTNRKYGDT